jgi:hypothetical protein
MMLGYTFFCRRQAVFSMRKPFLWNGQWRLNVRTAGRYSIFPAGVEQSTEVHMAFRKGKAVPSGFPLARSIRENAQQQIRTVRKP